MRQGCLVMSTICLTLGIGITWAIFHASGSLFSAMLQFVIEETWYARISAHSFGSQLGISSGPAAFRGFNFSSADSIADSDTISGVRSFSKGRNRLQSLKRLQWFNKRRIEHICDGLLRKAFSALHMIWINYSPETNKYEPFDFK